MKRILALILAISVCLSMMGVAVSAAGSTIALDNVAGSPGSQIQVNVTISGNPGLAYLKIKVGYDSNVLTLISTEEAGLLDGKYTTSKTIDVNPYVMLWSDEDNTVGDGVITTLTFEIKADAKPGASALTLSFEECYNEEFDDVIFTPVNGVVTVEAAVCPHANMTEVPAKAADCENSGNNKYYTCGDCGVVLKADGETETTVEAETIAALGHDMGTASCLVAATCRRCGHVEGNSLGHSFTNYVSNNDATCTADGTKTAKCDRCDVINTVVDAGSAKGHDYADATCTAPKTCKVCGGTEGEALGHNYADAWSKGEDGHWHECTACGDKTAFAAHDFGTVGDTCVVCGYERAHLHRLTLVPAVAPSCEDAGHEAYYTCSGCEEWFQDAAGSVVIADKTSVVIAALGHDDTDATCTVPAICKVCGKVNGEALGHSFTNYVSNNNATCTVDGTKTAKCDRCDVTDTVTDTGSAKGHDYADATCIAAKTCKVCGNTEGEALGHGFNNYISNNDATCTADGTKTSKCDRCDVIDTVTDIGSAKGHDYTDADCTNPKTCKVCGATEGEALGHNYAEAWSKGEDGHWRECTACGDKTAFAAHDFGTAGDLCVICAYERDHIHRLALVPAVDATCENGGNKAYYTCSGCENWFEDASGAVMIEDKTAVVIAALGHSFVNYVSNDNATCTEDGTKTAQCDRCDVTDTVTDTGSAKGHDYADATCTIPATCQVCGEINGEALGHSFTNYISNDDATCTEDGTKTAKCDRCDVLDTVVDTGSAKGHDYADADCTVPATCKVCGDVNGEALGHSFTNYVSNGDTTCTEDGTKTAKCDRCDVTDTITDIGSAKGHDYTDADCTNPKTCQVCGATDGEALGHNYADVWSKGEDGHWHECTACGDKTDFAAHDFGTAGDVCVTCGYERAHVHSLILVPAVDATCEDSGNKAYYTCSGCENWFEDASGAVMIEDKTSVVIAALGHDYIDADCTAPATCKVCGEPTGEALGHSFTNYVSNDDATCTEDGTKTAKCDRCDETDTVADTGSAKGHDYADADCTAPATCKVCGETTGEALGHSFTNYVSNDDATCTEDGTKTAKCDRCDETDTVADTGSAKGHDYADATCTAPATCKVCGEPTGEALGHSFTNYVSNDDATCTEDGTKTAKCDRCDVTDTVADEGSAKGHDYADATCTVPATCKVCGETEGEALGHNYADVWSKGEEGHWHECTACGDKADSASHDYGTAGDTCEICGYERTHAHRLTLVAAVAATCEDAGHEAYYTCSGCEDWFKDEAGSVVIEDKTSVVIAVLGHDYADADCNAPATCKVCGETNGAALGHSFTNYVSNNDATCTEDGTKTAKCDRCDETDTVADTGSAKGHDYADADCTNPATCKVCGETDGAALGHSWVDATCTEAKYCQVCGEAEGEALGHDFQDGVCTRCDEEEESEPEEPEEPTVPSTPVKPSKPSWMDWFDKWFGSWWGDDEEESCDHSYTAVVKDPTCTEKGYTTHTCEKCGDSYTDSYVAATGHHYENGQCTGCGKTENKRPIWGGWFDWFWKK